MSFNPSQTIEKKLEPFTKAVDSNVCRFNALNNDERYDRDAMNGGNKTKFENESKLRLYYDDERAKLRAGRFESLKQIESVIEEAITEALQLDADEMTKFSEVAKMSGLSDSDMKRLARNNRENYSALVALSSSDNKFSHELKLRLDAYKNHLEDAKKTLYRYFDKATFGEKSAVESENWKWWVSSRLERITNEYNELQEYLQDSDTTPRHPLQDMFNRAAERL